MKKKHLKSVLMLLVSTIFCFQLFAQKDIDKLKSEIESINAKLVKANIAGDLETIASFYTDDIIHMPNYAPMVKGKEIMIEKEKETREAGFKMLSMNLNIVDVMACKDLVIEIGEYALSLTIPEMSYPVADNGKYVTVWERQKDGSLKIKIETWNTDVNPMEMGKEMMEKKKVKKIEKEIEEDIKKEFEEEEEEK